MVLYDLGYVVRMVRASMVEVMTKPYIRTAMLKGCAFRDVVMRHALRNALIAPFTVILLQINYLVTGVVVVEAVFAYPGFGRMMLEAALFKDMALIEAGGLVAVFIAVITQIVGDFGYMLLEPAHPDRLMATVPDIPSTDLHGGFFARARTGVSMLGESWPAMIGARPGRVLGRGGDPRARGSRPTVPTSTTTPRSPTRSRRPSTGSAPTTWAATSSRASSGARARSWSSRRSRS